MKTHFNLLISVVFFSIILGCSVNSDSSKEEDLNELIALKKSIEQLIATGICTLNSECDYIAFGSKPCGGPKSYLVFSSAINVPLLQQKVETYNNLEQAFNLKWNIVSDCMVVLPPTSLECVQGKCTANY